MPSLLPQPKWQFHDTTTGRPLSGGKLYTYVAGSTTPLVTYTSQDGATENTNPIILDSRGECSVFFGDGLAYKIALYDSHSNLIMTADHVAINQFCFVQDTDPGGGPGTIWVDTDEPNATTLVQEAGSSGLIIVDQPIEPSPRTVDYGPSYVWQGGDANPYDVSKDKFGKWRVYHNTAESSWVLAYNQQYNALTHTWGSMDVTTGGLTDLCVRMRFDCAEGHNTADHNSYNFWGIEWSESVDDLDQYYGSSMHHFDRGDLVLSAANRKDSDGIEYYGCGYEPGLVLNASTPYGGHGNYVFRAFSDNHWRIQETHTWQVANSSGGPPPSGVGIRNIIGGDSEYYTIIGVNDQRVFTPDGVSIAPLVVFDTAGVVGTYQIPDSCECLAINAAVTSMTINMPLNPVNGQCVEIANTVVISGLALTAPGKNIVGPFPAAMGAASSIKYRYSDSHTMWVRVSANINPVVLKVTETSGTTAIPNGTTLVVLDNAGSTSQTIVMPTAPNDMDIVRITCLATTSGMTHSAAAGDTISGPLSATPQAGTGGSWQFYALIALWCRIDAA